ncbi:TIGR02285 family protein [Bowmanella dokdonensis]|uniref:TIGR02285 family protein n=1 Tax=Bowmanella dokdonensis TaxID=751969 RepID=A0A939DNQ2_9ALTE|nr:TIGR02285 family protein [Bowmanella dokdonensis]MBN7825567.1 TIGR02285 family protein [Bowmanella dokdonensis]
MPLVLLLMLFLPALVKSQEILWLRPDFPPATFVRGPLQDKGYNDLSRLYLADRLPEYTHRVEEASYERIARVMKERNACIVGFYKSPQREKHILYSQPRLMILANGLIIRASDRQRFAPFLREDGIDVEKLAEQKSLLAGVADGRLYKGSIDPLIERHRTDGHFHLRSGQDVFFGLLRMLDRGRIDYTFGFPVELTYQQRAQSLSQAMVFLPVAGMPKATQSYVACSRNPWGEKVIARINGIIAAHRLDPEYLSYYQSWLDPDSRAFHQRLTEAQ